MTKDKKILFVVLGILIVVLLFILMTISTGRSLLNNNEGINRLQGSNSATGDSLTVNLDGRVEIKRGDTVYSQYWSSDKTNAFFAYYNEVYGDPSSVQNGTGNFDYENDELIDAIVNDSTGNGGNGGSGGQDIDDFFNTPTPPPSGNNSGGGSTSTPTPSSPAGQPWCLYWRLSYCVIVYQTPNPSTGASPTPGANILPPTCPENTITGRTVIGNELCFSTPTPTPQ